MVKTFAATLLAGLAAAGSQASYVPFVMGGGEVAVQDAGLGLLKDWRVDPASPYALLFHDRDGQWYRAKVGQNPDCAFRPTTFILGGYGTDPSGLFGPGMWVQHATYPYKRCLVHSTRPIPTPADQIGVDYAAEYGATPSQVIAQVISCRKRMNSFLTRPLHQKAEQKVLCR